MELFKLGFSCVKREYSAQSIFPDVFGESEQYI
jgi:hypothetical protein